MQETLQLAIVQTHLYWENPVANRSMLSAKMASISSTVDLIILPEMFTSGFTMQPQTLGEDGQITLSWMKKEAAIHKAAVLGSIAFKEGDTYYNRLFFVLPNGEAHQYNKRHTFTLAGEDKAYKAGKERLLVTYKGFTICPFICYDLRFPVWSRYKEDYDVLVYVANWPKPRIAAWDTLLKARAIENMCYTIGANRVGLDGLGYEYTGHSAVYDALGKPLVFSIKEEVLYTTLTKSHVLEKRNALKFLEDRDRFTLEE